MNGANIAIFLNRSANAMPTAITVIEDKVFWAESNKSDISILFVTKNEPNEVSVLRKNTPKVMEMFVYDPKSQRGKKSDKNVK